MIQELKNLRKAGSIVKASSKENVDMYYPDLKEVKELSSQGNYIPVYKEVMADMETAVSAFYKVAYDEEGKRKPFAYLLESVEGGENIGRYSFIGVDPMAIFRQNGDHAQIKKGDELIAEYKGQDCFSQLSTHLKQFQQVSVEGLAPFNGGAVGYASFETIEQIEPTVKCQTEDGLGLPDAVFMISDTVLAFDRVKHKIQVISHVDLSETDDVEAAYAEATAKIDALIDTLSMAPAPSGLKTIPQPAPLDCRSNYTYEEFEAMVKKAQNYIVDGDVIQVVLSQRFEADLDLEPIEVHRALRMVNPSPYMFCIHLEDDVALCGTSPEIHARCEDRKVTVRPIAGTRKRGKTPEADLAYEKELMADPKEIAEHVMLVDLGRNDVGRIAETGSVEIENLMKVEKYSHVMHIVSNVTGTLQKDLDSSVSMSSTFPAGTVSGAPKIRAMQIIAELEKSRRGPYAGTVAYFSFDGNIDSCITIRTVILKDQKAYIQAGAGVVADSDPELEFKETQNKARAMMVALASAKEMSKK